MLQFFLLLLFPRYHAIVNWLIRPQFLDTELQSTSSSDDSGSGKRFVDMLVKLTMLDGGERTLYIHIEVQSQRDPKFPERMFQYSYRLCERYIRMPLSLAVLGDANKRSDQLDMLIRFVVHN